MSLFARKPEEQVTLEDKIQKLRGAGMTASADRLEFQLRRFTRGAGSEKIKPLSPQELAQQIKAQRKAR